MTLTRERTLAAPQVPPEQGEWTYEDWLRLPDDDATRYEVIDGELHVTPPPSVEHQFRAHRLAMKMTLHADAQGLGIVLPAPIGVMLPGQSVPIQPDIVFVSASRRQIIGQTYIEGAPDLVVEVLSPSNWPYDRGEKFRLYQSTGIPEYWIVDYRKRQIEVFTLEEGEYALGQGVLREGDIARSRELTGFEVAVSEIFQPY